MSKGFSPIISLVLVVLLSVVAIAGILTVGIPAIESYKEAAVLDEAGQNMRSFDNAIREVASEGFGVTRSLEVRVTEGNYFVNPEVGSFDYVTEVQNPVVSKGTFLKDGPIEMTFTGSSSASQNSTHIILENEVLEAVFSKVGSESSFAAINTSDILKTIRSKQDGATIAPNETLVTISNFSGSGWGSGYTKIAREGTGLSSVDMVAHVRSQVSGIEYDLIYTLPASADFLVINMRNVSSANQTTLALTYMLGSTGVGDVIRVGDANETTVE